METLPTEKCTAERKLYGITLPTMKVITGSRKQPLFWGRTCFLTDETAGQHFRGQEAVLGVNKWRFCQSPSDAAGYLHTEGCRSCGQEKCLCLLDKEAALTLPILFPGR